MCKIVIVLIAGGGGEFGDLGVAGGIIVLACILKMKDSDCEFVDWRYLFQGRVRWQAVVSTALN